MSLLNDALRKKTRELDKKEKTHFLGYEPEENRKGSKKNIGRAIVILFFFGIITLGAWHVFIKSGESSVTPQPASVTPSNQNTNPNHPPASLIEDQKDKQGTPNELNSKSKLSGLQKPARQEKARAAKVDKKILNPTAIENPALIKPKDSEILAKKTTISTQTHSNNRNDSSISMRDKMLCQKAMRYHQQDRFEKAIRLYLQVLRINPKYYDALFNLAAAYIERGEYAKAYPLLSQLKHRDPANPLVLMNVAIVEIGLGRSDKAIFYLDKAQTLTDAPRFEIFFHQGVAFSQLNQLNQAINCYQQAEKLNPNHTRLLFNIAVVYDKLKKYDKAFNYYRSYLQHDGLSSIPEKTKIEARIRALKSYPADDPFHTAIQTIDQ